MTRLSGLLKKERFIVPALVLALVVGGSTFSAQKEGVKEKTPAEREVEAKEFKESINRLKQGLADLEKSGVVGAEQISSLGKVAQEYKKVERAKEGPDKIAALEAFEKFRAAFEAKELENLKAGKQGAKIAERMASLGLATAGGEKSGDSMESVRSRQKDAKELGTFVAEADSWIKRIEDPKMQAEMQEAVNTLYQRQANELLERSNTENPRPIDPTKAAAAREKILGAIKLAVELGADMKRGDLISTTGAKSKGDQALGKAGEHDKSQESSAREGVSENSAADLAEIARLLVERGSVEDVEALSKMNVKEGGREAMKGLFRISKMYQNSFNELLDAEAGRKLSATERKALIEKLKKTEAGRSKLELMHKQAKLRTAGKLRELGVLTEEDIKLLCKGPCASGGFCALP